MTNLNTEKFAVAAKANAEIALTVANTLLAATERLAAHNLNTARSLIADSVAAGSALFAVKDAQSLLAVPASLMQPNIEKAVAYAKGVYAIASETQGALSHVFDSQYANFNREVLSSVEEAVKHAPVGSEVAVTAVKKALDAANTAYDNVTKATKQAVEIAESNVEAATSATLKAVTSTAPKAKKAA